MPERGAAEYFLVQTMVLIGLILTIIFLFSPFSLFYQTAAIYSQDVTPAEFLPQQIMAVHGLPLITAF